MKFHPDRNLPDCMLPDGGDCCKGHAAVCEDWHKQRRTIEEIVKALNDIAPAIEALAGPYQPLDMEGVVVGVSRQAIDEVVNTINTLACMLSPPSTKPVMANQSRGADRTQGG